MTKSAALATLVLSLVSNLLLAGPQDPVGSWRFDQIGSQVADHSGHGHPATAKLAGARVEVDGDRKVLLLDGRQRIVVPSSPELNLAGQFSLALRVRFDRRLTGGYTLALKDKQYCLRVDSGEEGQKLSFFVYAKQAWEPRVSSMALETGRWYHVVATWNGREASLWLNGEPFQRAREGNPPPPNDQPLVIASQTGHGGGVQGAIDELRIYRRVLSPAEILREAYGIVTGGAPAAGNPTFDFAKAADLLGWTPQPGAQARLDAGQLVVTSPSGRGQLLHKNLQMPVEKLDYLSLRMAVDRGSRGELIFVTTEGAGRMPFEVRDDGLMHSYVLEPWTQPGWRGTLLAMVLAPSEIAGATARIESLRLGESPVAGPELRIDRIYSESTLPRAGRVETILARIQNQAGPALGLRATLTAPEGVTIEGPASQPITSLGYQAEQELAWRVRAAGEVSGEFRVTITGPATAAAAQRIPLARTLAITKADYAPKPVPADTGKYTLWMHYCPLWKAGTHYGWKKIEPWPERKPVIGWYNEGEPAVADWHIKMALEHGISGFIYCWYRTSKNEPVKQSLGHAIHDGLLHARYLPMFHYGIMWENGCGAGCGSTDDLMQNLLPFWIENYFSHPSYVRIGGKPVLYIWVPRNMTRDLGGSDKVREALQRMRTACREKGLGGLHIVGCIGHESLDSLKQMATEGWDATSAYGNHWRQPREVRTFGSFVGAPFESFVEQQEAVNQFKQQAGLLPDIPSAMMGWDPRPWNSGHFFWSENTAEKFRDLCVRTKRIVDADPRTGPEKNHVIFCNWDEFGEGHYLEPTRGSGFAYLDAIRDVFCAGPKGHLDVAPEDVGLGPYDSWHQKARQLARAAVTEPVWKGDTLAAWSAMMGAKDFSTEGGVIRLVSITNDPAIASPELKVRASRYSKFIVELRASRPSHVQVFWSTPAKPHMSGTASVSSNVPADGQFHTVVLEVGKNEHWGGCLTGLRFDPTSTENTSIEIRALRLE